MKTGNIDNNIYNFRLKVLYHFYEAIFFNRNLEGKAVEIIKRRYEIPYEEFVVNNIDYLLRCGYLNSESGLISITPKGIKFIEGITDGELDFDIEKIDRETMNLTRRKFREQDTFNESYLA